MRRWMAATVVCALALAPGVTRADPILQHLAREVAAQQPPSPAPRADEPTGGDPASGPPIRLLPSEWSDDLLETLAAGTYTRPRRERVHPGISLGDDRDPRVQLVQVGVMAAGFGALLALCGGGKCLLP